ncbi:MAG: acyl carrier protein [Gammaproteobacteria bacterium]
MSTPNAVVADALPTEAAFGRVTPVALSPEIRAAIVSRVLKSSDSGIAPDAVRDDMTLRDDIGLASIDSLELALDLEEDLGVVLEDQELFTLRTVGDLMNTIAAKLAARPQVG